MEEKLALHETMEIHELINFKTVGMTKAKLVQGVVFDPDLKALLEKNVEESIKAVNTLQSLLAKTKLQ